MEEKYSMPQLDELDISLLRLLQVNSKWTLKELARELNLSTTPVFERIRSLEKEGVITGYAALVDRHKVGKEMVAYCTVTLEQHNKEYIRNFEQAVTQLEEVVECYHIAGVFDYLLKVIVDDINDYQHFVTEKLAALENLGRVQSSFVMNEIKHQVQIPI
jgi:DNA-binding Lrp family transcriptional regulator